MPVLQRLKSADFLAALIDLQFEKIFLVEWSNFAGEWKNGWVEWLK